MHANERLNKLSYSVFYEVCCLISSRLADFTIHSSRRQWFSSNSSGLSTAGHYFLPACNCSSRPLEEIWELSEKHRDSSQGLWKKAVQIKDQALHCPILELPALPANLHQRHRHLKWISPLGVNRAMPETCMFLDSVREHACQPTPY